MSYNPSFDFHAKSKEVLERIYSMNGVYPWDRDQKVYVVRLDSFKKACVEAVGIEEKTIKAMKKNMIRFHYIAKRSPLGLTLGSEGFRILNTKLQQKRFDVKGVN